MKTRLLCLFVFAVCIQIKPSPAQSRHPLPISIDIHGPVNTQAGREGAEKVQAIFRNAILLSDKFELRSDARLQITGFVLPIATTSGQTAWVVTFDARMRSTCDPTASTEVEGEIWQEPIAFTMTDEVNAFLVKVLSHFH
jgi:hypothetical protein